MSTVDGFPRELLTQPTAMRLAYFTDKVVAHPRLKEVHEALLAAIHRPTETSLILVCGPTGVGKTTLRRRIEKQLIDEAWPAVEENPGRVPVVAIEAVAPESGQFNWKDYYTRALQALDEPLIKDKIDYDTRRLHDARIGRLLADRGAAGPALRRALEQVLCHRCVGTFIVDEAQHLTRTASGRRLLDQMDTLKSLAGLTGTVHVLVGTYELLGLANLSAQLSRRSREIHFGRYRAERPEDLRAFQSVLLTFQCHLPLTHEPDLVARSDYLYERSVGCIGVLKSWLNRAFAAALDEGATTLHDRHLEQHAEPARKLLSLAREITEGEAALRDNGAERGELRRLLGLAPEPTAPTAAKARAGETAARRSAGRVGRRQPTRDPVGAPVDVSAAVVSG
ncbi:MAG: ATP-binding protein [Gemmatimonadota bacterium]|nr:ATP-binding protein [Gemmatimonadota bacterium]